MSSSTCRRGRCARAGRRASRSWSSANLDGTLVAYLDRCACSCRARSGGALARRRPSPAPAAPRRTTCGSPGAPVRRRTRRWSRCRCCPSAAAWKVAAARTVGVGMTARARGLRRLRSRRRMSQPRRPRRRPTSAASSARSTSASGTATSPTPPSTGCCACAGPATCCSRREGAGGARFRGVGEDVRRVDDLVLDDAHVGRACGSRSTWCSSSGTATRTTTLLAFYPGPGGATESSSTCRLGRPCSTPTRCSPRSMPDVEAVLLRRHDGGFTAHLVPIDVCYELVGVVREHCGRVCGGGAEVWQRIAAFFDGARPSRPRGPPARAAPDGWPRADRLRLHGESNRTASPRPRRRAADARRRTARRARARGCAPLPGPGRAASPRLHRRPRREAWSTCSATGARWGTTMQALQLAFLSQVLPGFAGETATSTCRCRAATTSTSPPTSYLAALEEGEVPLLLLFSGTVFTGAPGTIEVSPVAWHKETRAGLPVKAWRRRWTPTSRGRPGCASTATPSTGWPAYRSRARAGRLGGRDRAAAQGGGP